MGNFKLRRLVKQAFDFGARRRIRDAEIQVAEFVHELGLTAQALGNATVETERIELAGADGRLPRKIVAVSFRAHFADDGGDSTSTTVLSLEGRQISMGQERFDYEDLDALLETLTRQVIEKLFAGRMGRLAIRSGRPDAIEGPPVSPPARA